MTFVAFLRFPNVVWTPCVICPSSLCVERRDIQVIFNSNFLMFVGNLKSTSDSNDQLGPLYRLDERQAKISVGMFLPTSLGSAALGMQLKSKSVFDKLAQICKVTSRVLLIPSQWIRWEDL